MVAVNDGEWYIGFNRGKKRLGFKLGPKELRCCMGKNSLNIKATATFVQVPALSIIGITLFGLPHGCPT